ncbi:MAG: GFA family protein [Cyanobacteriota bacterium]|nr:GFA family protein [Cyanobacteriota bacterium]
MARDERSKSRTHEGGCHCGAIRFQVEIDKYEAIECNCSICRKKGFIHLIVGRDRFKLLQGTEQLATYTFNTGVARHSFCRICGIHAFYRPRSHPDAIDVNVRCLDEDILSRFKIEPFDGVHWEQNASKIQEGVR